MLNTKDLNGWGLFWLISLPMSVVTVIAMTQTDLSTGQGVESMIAFSVRWAVPLIYLVVAASAVQVLFPGSFTRWWSRNRKFIGLSFAVAMAWQGLFILIMSNFFRGYYFEEIYLFRDELEGSVGYLFLAAMVVTSFKPGRSLLTPAQWKLLHRAGVYFLWAYPFSVYWWALFYYDSPRAIDHVFYWAGFVAFALRIAAWGKKRQSNSAGSAATVFKLLGGVLVGFGLVLAATGRHWQAAVTEFLTVPQWSAELVLWLPFWPFEPFLPLFIIGSGVALATRAPG